MSKSVPVAVVVIGRNEGDRLVECLTSLQGQGAHVIYVDSGSTDQSVANAIALGADVVNLDMTLPFTAARARNAGFERLCEIAPLPEFVQFVDGDCRLHADWLVTASAYLTAHPNTAAVSGRLREVAPEASVYNRMADMEWNAPVGEAKHCGGIAMMRVDAFHNCEGFNESLIAGEEPELCVRLRAADWTIWRLSAEMGWHDAAMTRFGQWWRRGLRFGFASAQGTAMHGAAPERHNVRQTSRAVLWGLVLPALTILSCLFFGLWGLALLAVYPLQMLRQVLRGMPWMYAFFLTLAKVPEGLGVATYWWGRLMRRQKGIIEYK